MTRRPRPQPQRHATDAHHHESDERQPNAIARRGLVGPGVGTGTARGGRTGCCRRLRRDRSHGRRHWRRGRRLTRRRDRRRRCDGRRRRVVHVLRCGIRLGGRPVREDVTRLGRDRDRTVRVERPVKGRRVGRQVVVRVTLHRRVVRDGRRGGDGDLSVGRRRVVHVLRCGIRLGGRPVREDVTRLGRDRDRTVRVERPVKGRRVGRQVVVRVTLHRRVVRDGRRGGDGDLSRGGCPVAGRTIEVGPGVVDTGRIRQRDRCIPRIGTTRLAEDRSIQAGTGAGGLPGRIVVERDRERERPGRVDVGRIHVRDAGHTGTPDVYVLRGSGGSTAANRHEDQAENGRDREPCSLEIGLHFWPPKASKG